MVPARIAKRTLTLAILAWLAACAESYVDPPLLPRPVPVALAAYEVRRPGLVLFDREARAAELRAMPEARRRELCGGPERKGRWPSHGVVRTLRTRGDGGPDGRGEPFALTVMRQAAAAYGLGDGAAREALVRQLDRWARGGGLTRFDPGAANAYYAVDRTLLPAIVAWSLVRDDPPPGEAAAGSVGERRRARIDAWLRHVARVRGDLRPQRPERDATTRNNHRYLSASASMAWGALAGEDAHFREGFAAFDQALADMRADGSLPLETERGARALWYQRHAIASLVAIAELAAAQGYDLYAREGADGRSLHRAVRFLLDAIDDPDLVRPYAEADRKAGTALASGEQDLGFLLRRGHDRHYMAWTEPYVARFPDREESRRLLDLLRRADPDFRPMLDDYSGGNTSCFFAR